jgi:hypothetical protein
LIETFFRACSGDAGGDEEVARRSDALSLRSTTSVFAAADAAAKVAGTCEGGCGRTPSADVDRECKGEPVCDIGRLRGESDDGDKSAVPRGEEG